jgi:hypothetical protein
MRKENETKNSLPRLELYESIPDRYAHIPSMAVRDGDVDIGRKVAAFPEWGEIGVPGTKERVDQFFS